MAMLAPHSRHTPEPSSVGRWQMGQGGPLGLAAIMADFDAGATGFISAMLPQGHLTGGPPTTPRTFNVRLHRLQRIKKTWTPFAAAPAAGRGLAAGFAAARGGSAGTRSTLEQPGQRTAFPRASSIA